MSDLARAESPATLGQAIAVLDARVPVHLSRALDATPRESRAGSRLIRFSVGSSSYAVHESFVTELDRVPKITLVPQAPAWLRGVTNLRGDILSVVDLRSFIGLDPTAASGRMLVLRLPEETFSLGLLVDTVDGILVVEDGSIQPPAPMLEGPLAPYLSGMSAADGLVAVLDLDRLLRSSDIRQFDEVHEDSRCEAL